MCKKKPPSLYKNILASKSKRLLAIGAVNDFTVINSPNGYAHMSNSPGTDKDSAKAAWHNYSMCLHTLHGNNALIEQNYNNSNRVLLSCFTTGVIIVTCLHMLHGIMLLINISNSFTMAPTNGSLSQKVVNAHITQPSIDGY